MTRRRGFQERPSKLRLRRRDIDPRRNPAEADALLFSLSEQLNVRKMRRMQQTWKTCNTKDGRPGGRRRGGKRSGLSTLIITDYGTCAKATRGSEGYGFTGILEIIAESAGKRRVRWVPLPFFQTWCGLIGVPAQTFRKLGSCRELGLLSVSFPKLGVGWKSTDALAEMADEYSSRKASRKGQAETLEECRQVDNVRRRQE